MASVQSKIGWKRPRKTENKNYHPFRSFLALHRKFKKKNAKKFKKLPNTVMDTFQAKIGWKRMR